MDTDTPKPILRIIGWEELYERSQSRRYAVHWVPMENRMGEDGYCELMLHERGAAHFGVWTALVFVASKSPKRGALVRSNGEPHTVATLSRVTQIPEAIVAEAVDRFLNEIRWLEHYQPHAKRETARDAIKHPDGDPAPAPPANGNGNRKDPEGFSEWWPLWCSLTGLSDRYVQSRDQWRHDVTNAEQISAAIECTKRYGRSDKVFRKVIMNPDNFIRSQSKNAWRGNWPEARAEQLDRIEDNLRGMRGQ